MISLNLSYFYGSAERSAKINTPHGTTKYLIDKKF